MSRDDELFLYLQKDSDSQPELIEIQNSRRLLCFASDFDATVAFYRDVLEIPMLYDKRSADEPFRALFDAGPDGLIEVLPVPPWRKIALGFNGWLSHQVGDMDAWYHRLSQKGLPVSKEARYVSGAMRSFSVVDPDGYEITFVRKR